jgi:transposase
MAKGKIISEEVRWIIIRLSTTMREEEIAMYTDVHAWTVRKILVQFQQKGGVEEPKQAVPKGNQVLCDYDIQVCVYK